MRKARLATALYLLAADFGQSVVLPARRVPAQLAGFSGAALQFCRRFSSVVEQLIRNDGGPFSLNYSQLIPYAQNELLRGEILCCLLS